MSPQKIIPRVTFAVWLLLIAAAVTPALAVPPAGPVQWLGTSNGSSVALYLDGQKATGGVHLRIPAKHGDVDLSGTGSGRQYTGTLRGTAPIGGPLSGTWSAQLSGDSGTIFLSIERASGESYKLSLPLLSTASLTTLRCAWLRGSATRRPKNGNPLVLRMGDTFQLGDTIETAAASAAVVVLADRSIVLMQEKTRVEIPDVPENRQGIQRVRTTAGKVWFAVKKVQDGNHFQVDTDEVVAAVRGTEFLVEVDEAGHTSLTTAEGEVGMNDLTGSRPTIPVPAGMVWRAPLRGAKGPGGIWGPGVPADLSSLVRDWRPLLRQADRFWPLRRLNKPRFWQGRFRENGPERPVAGERMRKDGRAGRGPNRPLAREAAPRPAAPQTRVEAQRQTGSKPDRQTVAAPQRPTTLRAAETQRQLRLRRRAEQLRKHRLRPQVPTSRDTPDRQTRRPPNPDDSSGHE